MSKVNILDFHKSMKNYLSGIAEKADQQNRGGRQLLQDIRKLEEDLNRRLEEKEKQSKEVVSSHADDTAAPSQPVEVPEPKEQPHEKVSEKKTDEEPENKEGASQQKEKKSTFSVYRPDLSQFKPNIRVVRSAKDEAEQQKQREPKKVQRTWVLQKTSSKIRTRTSQR